MTSHFLPSDANEVDAVPVSILVWKVVAEMCSIDADSLSISETSNVFPDDFLIAETWPPVLLAFLEKVVSRATLGCDEERFSGDRIVISDLCMGFNLLNPRARSDERVTRMLCVVSIVATDSVSSCYIAAVQQRRLDWVLCCAMTLLAHD